MSWVDEYKKGAVSSSELKTEMVRITVHRHIDFPGEWRFSCYEAGIANSATGVVELSDAKNEAFAQTLAKLDAMANSLREGHSP